MTSIVKKLKRVVTFALGVALVLSVNCLPAQASQEGWYTIVDGELIRCDATEKDLVLPDGIRVIKENCFAFWRELTSIIIPDSVVKIEDRAFAHCSGLTSMVIPDSVVSVGARAFSGCENLKDIKFSTDLTDIGAWAFEGTPWLENLLAGEEKDVIINGILLKHREEGFLDKRYVVPDGVTAICGGAFANNKFLVEVTLPEGVTKIGDYAFCGCGGLLIAKFPQSLTWIGEGAFISTYLTNAKLSRAVTYIGKDAFEEKINIWGGYGSYADDYARQHKYRFYSDGTVPPMPEDTMAYARTQNVSVNGTPYTLQTYALKDERGYETNYVKLRDIAAILDGSSGQFDMTWEGGSFKCINITPKKPYTSRNGTELAAPFSGDRPYHYVYVATCINYTSIQQLPITLTDDKGNGHSYYQLRLLGEDLGFQVAWTGDTIEITTA